MMSTRLGRAVALLPLVVLLASAALPRPAIAAVPGDWSLGLGLGWGGGRLSDNTLRVFEDQDRLPRLYDRENGLLLRLVVENRLLPTLGAGLEVTAWSRGADDALGDAHLDMLLLVPALSWHPGGRGLFLRLGYGLGIARVVYQERGTVHGGTDDGPTVLLGLGWDVPLNDRWTVTPRCGYSGFAGGDLDVWASLLAVTWTVSRRF